MDYTKRPGSKIELIGKCVKEYPPTISVVTPFYNGGATLMETARSLFQQTYPYFEWIIVDDGSKDKKSLQKLKELEKMDSRVRVYHQENKGPSVARDYGISKTSDSTSYVFFLDCDDLIDHTMLECLYWTLETHPDCSFAYTTIVNFGDREFLWERYLTVEQETVENLICVSSMVKKKDLLEVGCFGIEEKSMYEDWNLWLKLLAKGKKPIRVNAPLFWYRLSNTGEFSRAKKNNQNAMKYVRETAKTVLDDVLIVQYPRLEEKYATVQDYQEMILPQYEKSKKTKILFIFPWMVVGGADFFNLELIKRLDKTKYEAIVLTTTPNENVLRQSLEEVSSEVYDLSTFLDRPSYLNFTDYIISSRGVDIVVISNSPYGYYMTPYLKKKYPAIPFIDYIHSVDLKDPREGFGRCSMDIDSYLTQTYCCNQFTENQLRKMYHKENVKTLYIGVDEKKFDAGKYDREKLKEKYHLPKDKIIITFIARLSEEKRPLVFIEIAKKLLQRKKEFHFVIAGDGPMMNEVSSHITKDFTLLGMMKNTEEVYAMSDVTVNCSSLEGLALTTYESLSMGVPVVSSQVGGQQELVDSSVGGIVYYHDHPTKEELEKEEEEFVQKILETLDHLEEKKKNCRNKIVGKFTLEKMAQNFSSEIECLLSCARKDCEKKKENSKNYSYVEYNLALEAFHENYYYCCNQYLEDKFGIYYDYNKQTIQKRGKAYQFRRRVSFFLNRCYAKEDAKAIIDVLRSIKRMGKEILVFFKLLLKSIPAFFKLIYKLLFVRR